ncbi:BQ2448_7552 [Microbotryum intermedium]|uniref:BQ2448_7552 protein n=1 Tax=Microbotryum intermedium TaxID=269621 RepID=A0A238FRC2_9BASI|nr:BQ2448_7552 [Microbotryum intermedium]
MTCSSTPTPTQQALLTHLINRIDSDIDFLSSQGLLNAQDAEAIKAKLPRSGGVERSNGLTLSGLDLNAQGGAGGGGVGSMMTMTTAPTIERPTCRALWDYHGSQPDDLGFTTGQIIVIESELNQDWWQGSVDGRKGIFPSNHVERLPFTPTPTTGNSNRPPPPPQAQFAPSPSPSPYYANNQTQSQQQPTQYAYQQPQPYAASSSATPYPTASSHFSPSINCSDEKQQPYPQQQPYQQMYQPPPPPPSTTVAAPVAPSQPPVPKKRFGKVGGQLGTAFVGGLGFGTGSAVAVSC